MAYQIASLNYGEAIRRIARMVGHPIPVDAAGNLDPAIAQMGEAVNMALTELLTKAEWQDLTKRGSISVLQDAPGQKEKAYDLPEDFDRLISQTEWVPQQFLKGNGPLSAQQWQACLSGVAGPTIALSWQIRGDQIWFLDPPSSAMTLEFMYISNAQVIDGDDPTLFKNFANKNNDEFMLDPFLVMLLGRVKYLEWKSFDSSAAMRDFLWQFAGKSGADKSAPILSVSGAPAEVLIGSQSVPSTGFGA